MARQSDLSASVGGFTTLVVEVIAACRRHGISGEAARMAFFFALCLWPWVLLLFSITGLVGGEDLFRWMTTQIEVALPGEASETVDRLILEITTSKRPGILSFAIVLAAMWASNLFAAMADGLNAAYEVQRRRRWWQKRAMSLFLLFLGTGALLGGSATLLAGPEIGRLLRIETIGSLIRWPLAVGLLVGMLWVVYYTVPNYRGRRHKRAILAGAVVGAGLWGLSTLGFRLYVRHLDELSAIYGFVGGIMMLLVWLYLSAMSILVGGECAAALEKARRRPSAGRDRSESVD